MTDVGNSRVQRLGADGQAQAQWPIGFSIARDGSRLTGDAAGHIYVTVPLVNAVVVYDRAGKALAAWQAAGSSAPSAILALGDMVAVAYPADHVVRLFPLFK